MTHIGLVPLSGKPYHKGHHELILLAARENDEVHVYVSLSNRENISGATMGQIWQEHITKILPTNVHVIYTQGSSPVRYVFEELGKANEAQSKNIYKVYSDCVDIKNYDNLHKYANDLIARNQIQLRAISRTSTVNISGTQMRTWLKLNDKQSFTSYLPPELNHDIIWDMLKSNSI